MPFSNTITITYPVPDQTLAASAPEPANTTPFESITEIISTADGRSIIPLTTNGAAIVIVENHGVQVTTITINDNVPALPTKFVSGREDAAGDGNGTKCKPGFGDLSYNFLLGVSIFFLIIICSTVMLCVLTWCVKRKRWWNGGSGSSSSRRRRNSNDSSSYSSAGTHAEEDLTVLPNTDTERNLSIRFGGSHRRHHNNVRVSSFYPHPDPVRSNAFHRGRYAPALDSASDNSLVPMADRAAIPRAHLQRTPSLASSNSNEQPSAVARPPRVLFPPTPTHHHHAAEPAANPPSPPAQPDMSSMWSTDFERTASLSSVSLAAAAAEPSDVSDATLGTAAAVAIVLRSDAPATPSAVEGAAGSPRQSFHRRGLHGPVLGPVAGVSQQPVGAKMHTIEDDED